MPEMVKMIDDLTTDRIVVDAQGWNLHLDPRAYSMDLELQLAEMSDREQEFIDAKDLDGQMDYLAGLLERVLQAKSLPQDIADPRTLLLTVQRMLLGPEGQDVALEWIGERLEAIGEELNPGWGKATIRQRLQKRAVGKTLVFFELISSGKWLLKKSPTSNGQGELTTPDSEEVSSQAKEPSVDSDGGAESSETSSKSTRRTRSKVA